MRGRFYEYLPLDPGCPGAKRIEEDLDDPYVGMSGCYEELKEDWESAHRATCRRCQLYGASNLEIID